MSTKFPLTIFVMELFESLRNGRCFLKLDWVPREANQMADDLTNLKFDCFDMQSRVRWDPGQQQWCVLDRFMKHAKEFHEELKLKRTEVRPPLPKKRKKEKSLGPW